MNECNRCGRIIRSEGPKWHQKGECAVLGYSNEEEKMARFKYVGLSPRECSRCRKQEIGTKFTASGLSLLCPECVEETAKLPE